MAESPTRHSTERSFTPHPVAWTPERVQRFWQWFAGSPRAGHYFARMVGDAVISHARRRGALQSPALDYGSGPGYLLDHLLSEADVSFAAADSSEHSLAEVTQRFAGNPRFLGTYRTATLPSSIPSEAFATVFFLETLEHLLPDELEPSLAELKRVTKPGGFVVLTTPNDENLAMNEAMCPECGAIFHGMQHVSSFTVASVTALLTKAGLEPVSVAAMTLRTRSWLRPVRSIFGLLAGRKPANLVAIARVPS